MLQSIGSQRVGHDSPTSLQFPRGMVGVVVCVRPRLPTMPRGRLATMAAQAPCAGSLRRRAKRRISGRVVSPWHCGSGGLRAVRELDPPRP